MKALALLVLPLAACAGPSISTDFEGASLGRIERVSETSFRCAVAGQADHEGRNRQPSWYSFRIDGMKGREVTITLTDLRGEYDYKPGLPCVRGDTPPLVSSDGKTWRHLETIVIRNDEATFTVTPDSDAFWVSHLEPYPASRLDRFLDEIRGSEGLKDEVIGKSVEGRDLHLLTLQGSSAPGPVVWLMFRQHAWESGTSFVCEGAVRHLLSPEGRKVLERTTFKILPMLDPDGCARGGVRFNRNGYDLNRNWDSADPASPESRRLLPEICAAKTAILESGFFDLFITFHNQETDEWMSGSQKHERLGSKVFELLKARTTFNPSASAPRPPRGTYAPGRATVYEYLEQERGRAAYLIEQGITKSSKLGRLPTSEDRRNFGRQLVETINLLGGGR